MARKKKHPEHENLERWLVSYSDFITLLFATFVVLYALSQVDISEFTKLEVSLREAFSSSPSLLSGNEGLMDKSSSIMDGGYTQGEINPIVLEFLSQKYEDSSYEDLKKEIDKLNNEDISAEINDKGLVLKINDKALNFAPDSAAITEASIPALKQLGDMIAKKFQIHVIRVDGHTDSDPASGRTYPTNWELSTARACAVVNFLIRTNGINPKLMIAAGYADTAPLAPNSNAENKAKNRRVEIVILRNKLGRSEGKNLQAILNESSKVPSYNQIQQEQPLKKSSIYVPEKRESALTNFNFKKEQRIYTPEQSNNVYLNESKRIEQIMKNDTKTDISKPIFMDGGG